jgi:Putative binding domain, N-terminal
LLLFTRSMNKSLSIHFSLLLVAALGIGASGCSSTTGPTGCQVITGNTTTLFPAAGGSASISVGTSSTCAWGAVSNAEFLTINQGASGAGNGTIVFTVAPNTGPQRTGSVTVTDSNNAYADTTITITQNAP